MRQLFEFLTYLISLNRVDNFFGGFSSCLMQHGKDFEPELGLGFYFGPGYFEKSKPKPPSQQNTLSLSFPIYETRELDEMVSKIPTTFNHHEISDCCKKCTDSDPGGNHKNCSL